MNSCRLNVWLTWLTVQQRINTGTPKNGSIPTKVRNVPQELRCFRPSQAPNFGTFNVDEEVSMALFCILVNFFQPQISSPKKPQDHDFLIPAENSRYFIPHSIHRSVLNPLKYRFWQAIRENHIPFMR
jgi:hypothetical protein